MAKQVKYLDQAGLSTLYGLVDKKIADALKAKIESLDSTKGESAVADGKHIAVGLRFETNENGEEEVTVAGDFWGTGLNQTILTNQIAQVYQKHKVIETCTEANWFIDQDSITTNAEGEIVIEAYRYA